MAIEHVDEAGGGNNSTSQQAQALGLGRWVQFAFVALALVLFWVLDRIATLAWNEFAEPQPVVVSLVAAVIAFAITITVYKNAKVRHLSDEVASELAKVSWPSRDETWSSTMVVIVTSLIAAAFLGSFDALWSAVTDLIYKV